MIRFANVLLFAFAVSAFAQNAHEEFTKAVFFGRKFFELKEYASAYEQFAKADALEPNQPGVLYNMAVLLAKSGKFSDAQRIVDRYLQLFPNGAEKALIARLQLELDFQRELQKKRQGDQSYAELFTRGKFLYTRNDLPGALKAFQSAEDPATQPSSTTKPSSTSASVTSPKRTSAFIATSTSRPTPISSQRPRSASSRSKPTSKT